MNADEIAIAEKPQRKNQNVSSHGRIGLPFAAAHHSSVDRASGHGMPGRSCGMRNCPIGPSDTTKGPTDEMSTPTNPTVPTQASAVMMRLARSESGSGRRALITAAATPTSSASGRASQSACRPRVQIDGE